MISRLLKSFRRQKVDLTYVDPQFLRKAHRNKDWSGETFDHFVPVGCVFESCSFEGCNFRQICFGGGLEDTKYVNCSFDRATIHARAPGNARFELCSFQDVEIIELYAFHIEMIDCKVSGIIRRGFLNGTVPEDMVTHLDRTRNVIVGNDFSAATLIDFEFRTGVDVSKQVLPDGWPGEA